MMGGVEDGFPMVVQSQEIVHRLLIVIAISSTIDIID
jgi:hypothetical protein